MLQQATQFVVHPEYKSRYIRDELYLCTVIAKHNKKWNLLHTHIGTAHEAGTQCEESTGWSVTHVPYNTL
jgi:hypothetical protein